MAYKLVVSEQTAHQIDECIYYIVHTLMNPSAAKAVLDDIQTVYYQLQQTAESYAFCEETHLHSKGYRKLALHAHDYLFVYRVNNGTVYLVGFFHMSENYQSQSKL